MSLRIIIMNKLRMFVTKERIVKSLEKTPWLLLGLSLCGWLIFVIAFGIVNHCPQLVEWLGDTMEGRTQNLFFPFWLCCFLGACLYISACLHLVLRRWFTAILLHALTAVYLISAGASIMTEVILNHLTLDFLRETYPLWSYIQVEMAGCVISFVSLGLFMTVWPLLSVHQLPPFLLSLRSHSTNQSDSDVTLIESGSHRSHTRDVATSHKFAVANTMATDMEGGEGERGEAAASTQQEKTALLPDKK